jgi:hypothetical protein
MIGTVTGAGELSPLLPPPPPNKKKNTDIPTNNPTIIFIAIIPILV